jgi:hypothetical protein
MQLLAVNTVIENVVIDEVILDKVIHLSKRHKRYHFKWGNSIWEQITLRDSECNFKFIELKEKDKGRLCQYQGEHYKQYEFIPE